MMPELTYHEAMKDVRARVKAAHTSFASGMSVLPIPRREAMYALYAFCRVVDDIADDSPTDEVRNLGLNLWRKRIHELFAQKKASDSITTALLPAIERFGLIEADFQDIIEGMAMDANQTIVAPNLDALDLYCDRVASAVGRVSVRIFGDTSDMAQRVAHHLGRALQLTNILRDLAEDAARGRVYLPSEILDKNGIETRDPSALLRDPALPAACRDLAAIAGEHFAHAETAMKDCNAHAMRPARAMRHYYYAIYKRLLKADWQNPHLRVSLPLWQKLLIALRGLMD